MLPNNLLCEMAKLVDIMSVFLLQKNLENRYSANLFHSTHLSGLLCGLAQTCPGLCLHHRHVETFVVDAHRILKRLNQHLKESRRHLHVTILN